MKASYTVKGRYIIENIFKFYSIKNTRCKYVSMEQQVRLFSNLLHLLTSYWFDLFSWMWATDWQLWSSHPSVSHHKNKCVKLKSTHHKTQQHLQWSIKDHNPFTWYFKIHSSDQPDNRYYKKLSIAQLVWFPEYSTEKMCWFNAMSSHF